MKTPIPQQALFFLSLCVLALVAGYYIGRLLAIPLTPILLSVDDRATQSTVQISGIYNGQLVGNIIGDVRVVIGNTVVTNTGSFSIAAGPLLQNRVLVVVPEGMRFVASTRGTRYYAVDSAGGNRITPENRIYFATEVEAEAAGYKR